MFVVWLEEAGYAEISNAKFSNFEQRRILPYQRRLFGFAAALPADA